MRGESAVIKRAVWYEKYRPTALEALALEDGQRKMLTDFLEQGEIPHLLLLGPPGGGKTTVARILFNGIDCSVLELNASTERGIDTIRDKVAAFATSMLGTEWNIVFLDEADGLTKDAQDSLRNIMEAYADRTRFILTGNYGHKIIEALHSRCQLIELGRPPLKERARILMTVLEAEGIPVPDKRVVIGYAEHFPDMRKMLSAAQRGWLAGGKTTLPEAVAALAVTGAQMFQDLLAKKFAAFKQLTTTPDFDVTQALRELFWAIPDDHAKGAVLRELVGRAVHESGFTPDPIILFLGAVSGAMDRA